ncbi:hypothetical protein DFR75_107112 [Nocardia ignorata]|uniref:Uncharacterized protein n=1 Tax=Nocardia ignorata TaxID=145285 RepID=A0A4R6P2X0_NOCIG|nr:hypothetical protein [Nocardia ignorata]TDP31887.1 hypothetical protein DFR75_107112 [Nocardia ignorata]
MEPALACLGEVVFDDIEIAIVDIGGSAVDGEPRAAVEHPAAPRTDLGDRPGPTDLT